MRRQTAARRVGREGALTMRTILRALGALVLLGTLGWSPARAGAATARR